jgi:hypothetical protein
MLPLPGPCCGSLPEIELSQFMIVISKPLLGRFEKWLYTIFNQEPKARLLDVGIA